MEAYFRLELLLAHLLELLSEYVDLSMLLHEAVVMTCWLRRSSQAGGDSADRVGLQVELARFPYLRPVLMRTNTLHLHSMQ